MTQQQMLQWHTQQIGQQLGAAPKWMVPITGETVGGMSIAELEAALDALRPPEQSQGPQVIYTKCKCSPSRSDCPGFG